MAQRPRARLGGVDAASAKHIGGQFESHITAITKDYITESDADLQHAFTSRSHESLLSLEVKKSAYNAPGWIIVDRQPMIIERPASSHTVLHGGDKNSSSTSTQGTMIPLQRWRLEAARAPPWNGLRQVSTGRNPTTEVAQTVKKSKASSVETCKDSTSQASFNDCGRRNGCT